MPTVEVGDIDMYYEIHGEGEPLVLIPGLRSDVSEYKRVIAGLSSKYKVIAIDNRGAGRTDKPDMPYSIEMMADDAAGLLNALGVEQAHILGVSMGGRIAAALALRHPEHVKSLILASTILKPQTQRSWSSRLLVDIVPRIPLLRIVEKYPQPHYAFVRQHEASRNFDCMDRLHEIRVPTLILHGKKDGRAPYRLAE
ncbi:MAG: alpha/beta hydrolase [Dehalococcoidia bacterium]|jgi:pimeloyl-ACP methyl ester carboxylesterase